MMVCECRGVPHELLSTSIVLIINVSKLVIELTTRHQESHFSGIATAFHTRKQSKRNLLRMKQEEGKVKYFSTKRVL